MAVVVLLPRVSAAQDQPRFESRVDLVQLDVVVLDEKGQPVRGLRKEDFEVREGGKRQEIVSFEPIVVQSGPVASAIARASAAADAPSRPLSHDPRQGRCLLVFIDDLHLSALSSIYVRKALRPLLESEVRDGDWVTVAIPRQGVWWTARTAEEHHRLARVIEGLRGRGPILGPGEPGDYDALRTVEDFKDRPSAETMAVYDRALRSLEGSVSALRRALESLRGLRGRKSLVVYSEGFIRPRQDAGLDEIVDLARQVNVAIDWIDPRGLFSGLPMAEAPLALTRGANAFGAPEIRTALPGAGPHPLVSADTNGAGSSYLAAATGGRLSISNDSSALLRDVLGEADAYYLLGYGAAAGRPGERRVQVRVRGEGRTVRARNRYFVRDPAKKSAFEVMTPTQQAVVSVGDETAIPVEVRTSRAAGASGGKSGTELVLEIGPRPEDQREGDLKVLIEARSIAGGSPVQQILIVTASASEPTLTISPSLALAPGSWQVRVVVSDVQRGTIGSALHTLDVAASDN